MSDGGASQNQDREMHCQCFYVNLLYPTDMIVCLSLSGFGRIVEET